MYQLEKTIALKANGRICKFMLWWTVKHLLRGFLTWNLLWILTRVVKVILW